MESIESIKKMNKFYKITLLIMLFLFLVGIATAGTVIDSDSITGLTDLSADNITVNYLSGFTLWGYDINLNGLEIHNGTINTTYSADYIIYLDKSVIQAKNGRTGVIDYSGSDLGLILNNIETNNLTSGGKICFLGGNYHTSTTYVMSTNFIFIDGGGCIIIPDSDINIIELQAPVSQIKIENIHTVDSNHNQTSKSAIFYNLTGGQVNQCKLTDITIYYPYNGISTNSNLVSNLSHSIIKNSFTGIGVHSYRGNGMYLFSVFDTHFQDIYIDQNTSASHGFLIHNSTPSGSSMDSVRVLGQGESGDSAYYFDNIKDWKMSNIHADVFDIGYQFENAIDRVIMTNIAANDNNNHGMYVHHSSGNLTILGYVEVLSTNYAILQGTHGGYLSIIGGDVEKEINIQNYASVINVRGHRGFDWGYYNAEFPAYGPGDTYYNTTDNIKYCYNGSTWNALY